MNIATILIKMVEGGCKLQINGRIKDCTRPIGKNILKYGRDGVKAGSKDGQTGSKDDQANDSSDQDDAALGDQDEGEAEESSPKWTR